MITYQRTMTIRLELPTEIQLHAEACGNAAELEGNELEADELMEASTKLHKRGKSAITFTLTEAACFAMIEALGRIEEQAGELMVECAHSGPVAVLEVKRSKALESQAAFANLAEQIGMLENTEPARAIGAADGAEAGR